MTKQINQMKKLIILLSIAFVSCSKEKENTRVKTDWIEEHGLGHGLSIVNVDGCEYVFKKSGYSGGLAHKGDCKNLIHSK